MNLFEVSASLTLDISQYEQGLRRAKSLISGFGLPAISDNSRRGFLSVFTDTGTKATEAIKASTIAIGNLITDMVRKAGTTVTGFIKGTVTAGENFDSAMSQVAATMGKSVDEIQNLRDFAKQMGATTKYSATESAQALNYMALAGYDAETSMKMLPNVMNLASAGAFDLARASDMLTDTQTAFGISLERTNQLVDEMAKAASTGNTSVEQLGDAFLTIGGLAKELNGGMVTLKDGTQKEVDGVQELEIALTSMANAGIKGSEAGTHMRNMLLKLSAPTEDATKFFEQYGIQIFDTAGNMNSLRDIFGQLNTQLSSMTQGDKLAAISDIFNARDTASAEALLAAIGENWDYIGDAIVHADGAASKMSQTQINNLAGAKTIMKSALEGLQITVSDALTPMLTDFVKFAGDSMQSVVDTVNKRGLSGLPKTIRNIIRNAGHTIRRNAPDLVKNTLSVLTEIRKGIADGIGIFPKQIKQTIEQINKNIREKAPEFLQAGINIKKNLISGISDNLPTVMEDITLTILTLAETLTEPENITTFVDTGIKLLTAIGEGIGKSAGVLAEKAPEIIANVKQGFEDNKEKLKETGRTFLTAIADGFGEDWTEIETKISQGIENIDFAKITENISKLIIGITDTAGNVIDGIDWTVIGGAIGEALNGVDWYGIIDSFLGAISTVMENAPELFKGIAETIDSETALQIATIGISLLTGKQIIAGIASYITGTTAFTTVSTALSGMLAKCAPVVGAAIVGWDIGTKIRNEIDDIELFDESFNEVIDGIRENVAKLRAGIESLWTGDFESAYRDAISAMYENGKGFASKKYNDSYMSWIDEYNADKIDTSVADYIDYFQRSGAYMWGQNFSQNFADGISENSYKVTDAINGMTQEIADNTEHHSPAKKGFLAHDDTWMPNMMEMFADGIQSNIHLVSERIDNLASKIKAGFGSIITSAMNWGSDLINNFMGGAKSKWDEWNSTWEDFGGVIYDLLHHSTPEKGLLKNDDEWMPDMMYNFISGIRDNIPALQQQAETAVSAIQTAFSSPVEMGDIEEISIPELPKLEYGESELEYNTSQNVEVHTSLIDTVSRKLDEIGNRIIDVVVNGKFDSFEMPTLQPKTMDINSRFNGFDVPQLPEFETEDIRIEVTFLDNLKELLEKFRSFKDSAIDTDFSMNIPDMVQRIDYSQASQFRTVPSQTATAYATTTQTNQITVQGLTIQIDGGNLKDESDVEDFVERLIPIINEKLDTLEIRSKRALGGTGL